MLKRTTNLAYDVYSNRAGRAGGGKFQFVVFSCSLSSFMLFLFMHSFLVSSFLFCLSVLLSVFLCLYLLINPAGQLSILPPSGSNSGQKGAKVDWEWGAKVGWVGGGGRGHVQLR